MGVSQVNMESSGLINLKQSEEMMHGWDMQEMFSLETSCSRPFKITVKIG